MSSDATSSGLETLRLNAADPSPLYHQLYAALRRRILDGSLPPESLLPPEPVLAEVLGVSLITVKRALNELAARGLVARERGRGRGTRVLPRHQPEPVLASIDGLMENSFAIGRDTDIELLDFERVPAEPEAAAALRLVPGTPVHLVVRVRRMGATPVSHLTTWLPAAVAQHFVREALSETPLWRLMEQAGVSFASAEQIIGAENAMPAVAGALGVEPGAALLQIVRTVFDDQGQPVEHTKVVYNPTLYKYHMQLERLPSGVNLGWRTRK